MRGARGLILEGRRGPGVHAGAPEPSKDAIIVGKEIALQRERDFARLREQFEGWDEDEEDEEY